MDQSWSDAAHRGRWKWAITGDYGMLDVWASGDWKAGVWARFGLSADKGQGGRLLWTKTDHASS
jgi:hypothetical protein